MTDEIIVHNLGEERIPKDTLLGKLFSDFDVDFGSKHFPYKLVLEEKLPEKFYKNRKFSLKVKLVNNAARSSSSISNSNFLLIKASL